MAWPPPLLPTDRTNATPQQDVHPADHNAANLAINDIVYRMGIQPSWAQFIANGASLVNAVGSRVTWIGIRSDGSIGVNVDGDVYFPSAGVYAIHWTAGMLATETHNAAYPYMTLGLTVFGGDPVSENTVNGGTFWMQANMSSVFHVNVGGKIQTFVSGEWLGGPYSLANTFTHLSVHRISPPIHV